MSDSKESISSLLALLKSNKEEEVSKTSDSNIDDDLLKKLIMKKLQASKNISNEDKIDLLKKRYSTFLKEHHFEVGMLVCWKPGLKNKGVVAYGEPAVVVERLATPIFDEERGPGSPYFMEPLDLVLAFLDEDNDFLIFYTDSRRFMPYQP